MTRGRGNSGCGDMGHREAGTRGRGNARGLEDGLEDFINKQHIDFCTEFVK